MYHLKNQLMQRQMKEVIFQIDMYFCFVPRVLKAPSFQNGSVFFLQQSALLSEGLGKLKLLCVSDCALNLLQCC